jgi:hypothetical protein
MIRMQGKNEESNKRMIKGKERGQEETKDKNGRERKRTERNI